MNGINRLAETIKNAMQRRIDTEARTLRGTIRNGKFISGARSYPYISAVETNTRNGSRVWAQLSKNNQAVIVGE